MKTKVAPKPFKVPIYDTTVRPTKLAQIRPYLEKFPNAGSLTLAKLIFTDSPLLFSTLEACRATVRYAFGLSGKANRRWLGDKSLVRAKRKPGYGLLQAGKRQLDWKPLVLDADGEYLILNDLHMPFHDEVAVKLALDEGKRKKVSTIIINGDLMDFYSISHWVTKPKERDLKGELTAGRAFLIMLREMFPKARIIYKLGNHDEWWEQLLETKAPELTGVDDFDLELVLRCRELNIEVVRDKQIIKIGHLSLLHGHEPGKGAGGVNPARTLYLKGQVTTACGHWHRSSQHSERNLDGKVHTCWSIGCLCDLHPRYGPLNNWNLGFARITLSKRKFQLHNYKIIDGELFE